MANGTGTESGFLRRHLVQVVATIALIAGIVAAFLLFIQDNTARIDQQNEEYLAELTGQRAASVDTLIAENLTFIASTAYLYGQTLSSPQPDVALVREYESQSAFDMLRFVDKNGDNYTSDGMASNLADRVYFQAGMRGETGVTYVLNSRVTGQRQIGFYAPVRYGDEIIGVMVGFYGEEYIQRLLEYGLFGFGGEGWLCDADGTVIGTTVDDAPLNFYDYLAEGGRCEPSAVQAVENSLAAGESTPFTYREGSEQAAGYAVPLEQADWVLVRNFPPSASSLILGNANREGMLLLAELATMFLLYVIALSITVFVDQRRTREENRNANDISHGVAILFEKFVTLDLRTGEYRYIGGTPDDPDLPPAGPYERYCESLYKRIPEQEGRDEAARGLSPKNLKAMLAKSDGFNMRVHAPTPYAEWLTYNFVVLEREGGAPVRLLVVYQDITSLYAHEQEEQVRLQQALGAAEEASRAKTEFLFNMSHDLRTPLNAIIGYTELAQRSGSTEAAMRDYIHKIGSSGEHLLALINDILEMSRIESGKMTLVDERTDLVRAMEEVRELFATQMHQKGLGFEVDTSGIADRWVMCDKNRLNRVALNLVSNAFKFTPEGGSVKVTLEQLGRNGAEGLYALRVADTGIGIGDDFVEKLFSAFERERTSTVSKTQGTGLGLSITKNIVDMMGGTIEVSTTQGEGTTFTVRVSFPVTEPGQPGGDCMPTDARAADFAGKRLLVVEDNDINLEIASLLLGDLGFEVDVARDGREALDKVAASDPGRYDAVLMDIQMPVMDGYEATRAIRSLEDPRLADVPIIAMTANAFKEDVQAALDARMDGHIAKPLDVDKMAEALNAVLSRTSRLG